MFPRYFSILVGKDEFPTQTIYNDFDEAEKMALYFSRHKGTAILDEREDAMSKSPVIARRRYENNQRIS